MTITAASDYQVFYWNQERVRMFEERFRLNGKNPGRSS